MIRGSIKAGLFALGLAAFVLAGSAFTAGSANAGPQTPPTPDECINMTFDKVVVMTAPSYVSYSADRELVFAPANMNGNVNLVLAHDSCIVSRGYSLVATVNFGNNVLIGGEMRDILSGGRGNDLIIGNGAPSPQKDVLSGSAGTDICIGTLGDSVKISCELDSIPVGPCSCTLNNLTPDAAFFGDSGLMSAANTATISMDSATFATSAGIDSLSQA